MREGGLGIFPQKKREKKTESFEKLQSILKRLLPEILKGIFHNEKVFHVQACRVSKLRISIASEAEFRLKFLLPTQTHPCEIASTLPLSIQTTWEGPSGEGESKGTQVRFSTSKPQGSLEATGFPCETAADQSQLKRRHCPRVLCLCCWSSV